MAKIKKEINITAKAKYSEVEKLNLRLKRTQSNLMGLKVGLLAATPALLKLGDMARRAASASFEFASQLKDLAGAAGVGTTELQVLGRVAATNGSSIEDMGKAVLKLTKSTQEAAIGNKQLAERFARLGVDIAKFKTLAPERQMERLGIAVNAASDKQAALAEVMALVGQDAGPKLMESLKKLGAEGYDTLAQKAQASGEVLSGAAIESLDRAGQAFKDLGHWFKVMTAEIVGAGFAVKDSLAAAMKTSAQAAEAKYGLDHWVTSEAHRVEAAKQLAAGDLASAEKSLAAAKVWVEAAHGRAAAGKLSAKGGKDMALIGKQAGTLPGSSPFLAVDQDMAALAEKLAAAQEAASAQAAKIAQAAAEAQAAVLATSHAEVEKWVDVELALLEKEQQAIAKLHSEAVRSNARERAAAEQQAQAQLERTVTRTREALAQMEFSRLAPSAQLAAQTQDFAASVSALYEAGHLGAEDWSRAQYQVRLQLEESARLLNEELGEAAWENAGQGVRELAQAFEALDSQIEGKLAGTINDFVETGTADMKKLGQSILQDVIKAMLKALVLKPLLSGLGGMFGGAGGGIFSSLGGAMGLPGIPGRASGGPVKGGSPYLVGEKGPELFMPPTSGTIIDANKTAAALAADTATGGERGPQNVYQIDARGADAGAVVRLEHALLKLAGPGVVERRATAAHTDRIRRG